MTDFYSQSNTVASNRNTNVKYHKTNEFVTTNKSCHWQGFSYWEVKRVMYEYRKLSIEERKAVVQERLRNGWPQHQPPHPIRDERIYFLTAACYEHQHHLTAARRQKLESTIFELANEYQLEVRAWVILTNHYHLLAHAKEFGKVSSFFKTIHGSLSAVWNRDDQQKGRKLWYRFSDRAIRSDRHYYTTLNYIHYNPVKHGLVDSPYDHIESSVHWYLKNFGRDWLRILWGRYPIRQYGKDWDEL